MEDCQVILSTRVCATEMLSARRSHLKQRKLRQHCYPSEVLATAESRVLL